MSRREDVDNAIWSDPDFRRLSPDAKLLYLWSFTNPRCPMAGIYKVDEDAMSFDTGLTPRRVTAALEQLREHDFIYTEGPWIWVRARVKYLRTRGSNMAKSIVTSLDQLPPEHPLRRAFEGFYKGVPRVREDLESVGFVFGSGIAKQEGPS